MNWDTCSFRAEQSGWPRRLLAALLLLTWTFTAAAKPLPLVSKWGRFEQSFRSSVTYTNPLQQAALSVVFTSPLGETAKVWGFWDGGNIWRVRFSPDQPGTWSFKTTCSDHANTGLDRLTGYFLCSAAGDKSRFDRHGPVRVARDHRRLEHQDLTPFFWLADDAGRGPVLAKDAAWDFYTRVRARQQFTVAQWIAAPGEDRQGHPAFSGADFIRINPEYFRQLDGRLETLNRAGILGAIVPLGNIQSGDSAAVDALPESQVVLLLRYMVARWGAHDVAWVLNCEGDNLGKQVARWKHIGRAVFGDTQHAPVILNPGETYWLLNEFRAETWVDVFGYQSGQATDDDALQWLLTGPVASDWMKEPFHPFINLATPRENEPALPAQNRASPLAVRRAIYWSLLTTPIAGVDYGAHGVWDWIADSGSNSNTAGPDALPTWEKSLFLPAAKQMAVATGFFNSIDFWRLHPAPELIAQQPGRQTPSRHVAAARTEANDLAVVYVPEDRTLELNIAALPTSPGALWINPRTGRRSPARAVTDNKTCQFPTPGDGDWLLLLQSLK